MIDFLSSYNELPSTLLTSATPVIATSSCLADTSDCSTDTCSSDIICSNDCPSDGCSSDCSSDSTCTSDSVPTVTCTKNIYLNSEWKSWEQETLYPGYSFSPSLHQPSVPDTYQLQSIKYGTTDVTTGSMTCPSSDFALAYYYTADVSDGTVWIYNGGWNEYQPYIYNGGWQKAATYIYDDGWTKA